MSTNIKIVPNTSDPNLAISQYTVRYRTAVPDPGTGIIAYGSWSNPINFLSSDGSYIIYGLIGGTQYQIGMTSVCGSSFSPEQYKLFTPSSSVSGNTYEIFYSNGANDITTNINVSIGNNGITPNIEIYNGNYVSNPLTGTNTNLPLVNAKVTLTLTGKNIKQVTCNGSVQNPSNTNTVTFSGVNGPLSLNFISQDPIILTVNNQSQFPYPVAASGNKSSSGYIENTTGSDLFIHLVFNSGGDSTGTINYGALVEGQPISVSGTITSINQQIVGANYYVLNANSGSISWSINGHYQYEFLNGAILRFGYSATLNGPITLI